ncbi:outer membrane beta-barrel protein [Dyella sp.]|jgi:hypothetical protein|uniref:outer membrane beta-barrel protein n=1 Tax=Dyella sp. TaxID=1869338 RepID=UPI002D7994E7|nr:outer membrane beta-barrel protein [Dyella sp.]HET6432968.1 outer membrane beta-barrel protein [Dyella sp.]
MFSSTRLVSAILLALATLAARATEIDYTLYSGVEHSDNIRLSSDNAKGESSLLPGFNFSLLQNGATVQANIAGDIHYRRYLGGDYTDQTQSSLAGHVNWVMLPGRLDLTAEDFASVQPVDTLASNAPENLQQTNVYSLGPTLHFRLGETLSGEGELRYINSYAQKTKSFNSQRGQAALRILKSLNATDQLSLNVETRRVTFSEPLQGNADYNGSEAYARYVSKLNHVDLDVALGYSQVSLDRAASRKASSPLARLIVNWHATERTTLGVTGSRQYSDAAQGLMRQPAQNISGSSGATVGGINGGTNAGNAVVSAQVYEERRAELNYAFRTERLLLTLAARNSKLEYSEDPTFNQTARGGSVGIDYRLQPTLTLSAYYETERRTYQTLDRKDRTRQVLLTLTRQVNAHWSWRTSLSQQTRSSNAVGRGFHENLIYVGVAYAR